ncbi:hypothetical protein [Methylobacterium radiotolerans]|uniref:hypothetical protein n=1 Tax=Methylobacterium radiotolerans TaxID=31998 RepID=UPI000D5D7EA9|nr:MULTISPECIES: hypothetical protein [Methylobacterium]MDE3748452.1 hypothetical protein [Methylobacterium radiotolerans]PVY87260.1 hypothetical protein C7388_1535 [Methylobacterium organophilum]
MRAVRLSGLVSAGLLGLLTAHAQAQTAAQPQPQAQPPMQAQDPAAADPRRNQAAKLAGLAGFVNLECPGLRSDPARLKQTVEALGVDAASLETGDLHLTATRYIAAYQKDVAANCRKAEATFGPQGSIIPGLVMPR